MITFNTNFETTTDLQLNEQFIKSSNLEDIFNTISKLSLNKKKINAKENALYLFHEVFTTRYAESEHYIIKNIDLLLILCGDGNTNISTHAKKITDEIINYYLNVSCNIKSYLLITPLLNCLDNDKRTGTKIVSLKYLEMLSEKCTNEIRTELIDIIPKLCDLYADLDDNVIEPTTSCINKLCNTIKNMDVDPFIPRLIEVFKNNEQSTEVIHSLASVTFVQEVDSATLSIIVPVLLLGFRSDLDSTKRLSAVIVANMIKLVVNPIEILEYMPRLLPILEKASKNVSEPEARHICNKSYESLSKLHDHILTLPKPNNYNDIYSKIACEEPTKWFVANLISILTKTNNSDKNCWNELLVKYTNDYMYFYETVVSQSLKTVVEDEKDDAELLCDCKFTLAYGSKILLHNTQLTLKRGYRYGLLGGNGSGKSTLLKAIVNEQIDGFPPSSILKTVFVEADILGELSHLSCLDYIYADKSIQKVAIPRDEIRKVMLDIGFTEKMCDDPVTTLSGGWRMKLALSRAMLQKADILLMDEPTNHLDVINVAWVENYLINLKNVTSVIVSHNKGVLDRCCTHIINIENFKLTIHRGNLTEYTKINPNAHSYFAMTSNSGLRFKFPEAGFIEGVKQAGAPLMRLENVSFKYPTGLSNVINNVNIRVSMASRVGCVGRNGQGKSTMIKLLTGELVPTSGSVWRKNALRFGYVSQHSFHHIEKHLDKTPTQYICERFSNGVDNEILEKDTYVLTDEEIEFMKKPKEFEIRDERNEVKKVKWTPDKLTGERKPLGRDTYQYELKWEGQGTAYYTYDRLEEWGFSKVMKRIDLFREAENGLFKRNLNQKTVEEILKDFGLEPEFSSHARMNALSASQKLKVVLAAAVWQSPSIIILDEPTNYFDRDSMIALSEGLKDYNGGFIVISHNDDFIQNICKEFWTLENGTLNVHGDQEWMANQLKTQVDFKVVDEIVDSMGNIHKVKQPIRSLSNKDKRQLLKKFELKKKNGIPLDDDEIELMESLTEE
jgi:elongation factor 3